MSRVVVFGSSGYDLTIALPRLPKPGETLLGGKFLTGPGGKGANQAIAAKRAGAEVVFLTAFGDDAFGQLALENARAEGIDLTFARVVEQTPNQVALIFVGADGQNIIGVAPGASGALGAADVDRVPDSVFEAGSVLLACLEVPLDAVARALERARGVGMTTVLNPAPADPLLASGWTLGTVDVLTPNQEELHILTGLPVERMDEVEAAASKLCAERATWVVVTLGEEGCLVVSRDGAQHLPAFAVEAVDTVGAGDAFSAVLAVALAEGYSMQDAALRACAAGALAVTRPSAQGSLPTRLEIERLIVENARRGS